MALFCALVTATFFGMCIYALVRARQNLAEDLRVAALLDAASWTTIREAPAAGRIHITGRASGAGGAVVRAPFSGEEALWARATGRTNIGQVVDEWVAKVDEIVVDDGSGRVAHVRLAGAQFRFREESVPPHATKRVGAFLESIGRSSRSGDFHYEGLLRPGETVGVVATISPSAAGYRESAGRLSLGAEEGELVVFDPDREVGEPDRHRKYISTAWVGIVFFGVVTAILLLVALG